MGWLIIAVGLIISIVICMITKSIILSLCLLLFSCIAGAIVLTDSNKNHHRINEKKTLQLKQKAQEAYDRVYKTIVIPDTHYIVDYKKGELNLLKGQQYCWIEDDTFFLFPCDAPSKPVLMSKVNLISIPKDCIDYFMPEGLVTEEKKVNEEGETEVDTYDTRKVTMKCKDDEGEDRLIEFDYNNLSILKALLPGKVQEASEEIVEGEEVNQDTEENQSIDDENMEIVDKAKSITEQIREVAKLKEEGILTEEEFNDKKKILLKRI